MSSRSEILRYYQIADEYIDELYLLQSELLKLQKHISDEGKRLAIIFEGRDTAGKGAAISRFTQFLNPQHYRIVALGKPTKREQGQWYFQRYIKRLPNRGEITFFDRSWYNRAVVEPSMRFCTSSQYQLFMSQVNDFERLISDDGIRLIKFWFSIDSESQQKRIQRRIDSPLERWKVSLVDLAAQEKWTEFTYYKEEMFQKTDSRQNPWVIVRGGQRERMRIEALKYVLSIFNFPEKSDEIHAIDGAVLSMYHEP